MTASQLPFRTGLDLLIGSSGEEPFFIDSNADALRPVGGEFLSSSSPSFRPNSFVARKFFAQLAFFGKQNRWAIH